MVQSIASGHAKAYFSDALSRSDYYVNDQELMGYWQGKLADRLGLSGATEKDDFFALCENVHPRTGAPLTPRTKEARRVGYDINFHCPKSVSVLHALSGNNLILDAFRQAITDTMQQIEADVKTRIRQGGIYDDRQTGELVWAHFTHQTARPVEGHFPDPHLHSHCFVFNATWDAQEQRYKAGQFHDIKRDMPYYQALFHMVLADHLAALGYDIRKTAKSFEIGQVPQTVIDLFSKRTDEIGRIAKEKGITDARELGELGARTRARKQKGASMGELKDAWTKQIKEAISNGVDMHPTTAKDRPALTAQQCLDYALLHCFERASVASDRRILQTAYRFAIGAGVKPEAIAALFKLDPRIITVTEKGATLCTTKEVLAEEKRMVTLARQGQGKMMPLYQKPPSLDLDGQQAQAVAHILTTQHRVSIVRGAAGSGKTTLMNEAVKHIEAIGKKVFVFAPSAQASRGVLKSAGFKDADTVARLILDTEMQEQLKGQIIWVDEAGLLGTKDMTALLDIATRQNARLILGGDTRQHASVVRGDALRILNTVAGIKTAEVNKIYRQKNADYKKAVENLATGNIADGMNKLDNLGFIKTIDPLKPDNKLVEDYIKAVKAGKDGLVISPTHQQGEEITQDIRKALRQEGLLGKKEITVKKLVNLNLTEAEKSDPATFETGQIIQFNQHAPGFKRGSQWIVEQADQTTVKIKDPHSEKIKTLPTQNSARYDVFALETLNAAKGDKIRITRNGFDLDGKRLDNGDVLEVAAVSKQGNITLHNTTSKTTYTLPQDFGHINHAHCITSHAAQGKTVDEVFIYQPAATFPATDAKQFYVSASRGKEKAHIYTDDKAELLHHASDMNNRTSALELTTKPPHENFIAHLQRQQHPKTHEQVKHQKQKDHEPDREI